MVQASVFVSTDLVDPIAKLVRELPHLDNALILYTPHMYVLKILAIKVMNVKSELVHIYFNQSINQSNLYLDTNILS